MNTQEKAAIAGIAIAIALVAAVLIATYRLSNTGTIITVGLTSSISNVDWGNMTPNSSKTVQFSVTNTGSGIGKLSMTTENLPNYLVCTWDSENATIQPQQARTVTITLFATPASPAGGFSFYIVLTANYN